MRPFIGLRIEPARLDGFGDAQEKAAVFLTNSAFESYE
jgi:hypothetical protein